jgi:hypothetical protein
MSPPLIGVLLPVRLETVIDEPAAPGGDYTLKVLVVPDEISIDRFDETVVQAELDDLAAMWEAAEGSLASPRGAAAFRGMAQRHGADRSAWLARRFPAGFDPRAATLRTKDRVSEIRGFPPLIEIWVARGGGPPVLMETKAVHSDKLSLDFRLGPANRWWTSWTVAEAAGLGATINLGPGDPGDIDLILALGLGEEPPAGLFKAHSDAGALAVLEPGTPTNTVGGAAAADLAADPDIWRRVVITAPGMGAAGQIGLAITGDREALGPVPGGESNNQDLNRAMVRALWPVLWGRSFKDVWDLKDEVFDAGLWAGDNLFPEGPLPPIRVNRQPYGLLPVTGLQDWVPAPGDPPLEARLRGPLRRARSVWADAALKAGTIVGADTQRALEVLGQRATSGDYVWRWLVPLEVVSLLSGIFGGGVSVADLEASWDGVASSVLQFHGPPARRYAGLSGVAALAIPLVRPTLEPFARIPFQELLAAVAAAGRDDPLRLLHPGGVFVSVAEQHGGGAERVVPDSLLLRLLVHALVLASAEVARLVDGDTGPLLEPISADTSAMPEPALASWLRRFAQLLQTAPGTLSAQAGSPQSTLHERNVRAIERLTRWEPAPLERVFRGALDTAASRIDPWITGIAWRRLMSLQSSQAPAGLGIYGWVEGPLVGQRGPTAGGLLHAPSDAQARAAIVLRDRAVHDQTGRWQMEIDSEKARLAYLIGEEVRQGAHIYEAVGRAVERRIRRKKVIEALRREFPQRQAHLHADHAVRRACNGTAVLEALEAEPGGTGPVDPRLASNLTLDERRRLVPLRSALEAYGDLLLADSAYHLIAGNAERAGATLNAAAGFETPPELQLLRTPRGGRSATSTVVTVLPLSSASLGGPGALADPVVAAFLQERAGPTADPTAWTWQVQTATGQVAVTLADLGLTVADSLALTADDLTRLALGHVGGTDLAPGSAPNGRETAERLARLLGARPALPADLATDGTEPADRAIRLELVDRLLALIDAARILVGAIRASVDEDVQRSLLREATRWGIAPIPREGTTLRAQVRMAGRILDARLRAVPPLAEVRTVSAERLATAIADLASPGRRMPVLSRLSGAEIGSLVATPAQPLGQEWLEIVAAVRARLAPIEAHQLGSAPFAAWTNRPGDPWQKALAAAEQDEYTEPTSALVIAYGPAGTLDGVPASDQFAVGLVDSWGEVVPRAPHNTVAAFGFNAPSARPPQSVLLAVTPDVSKSLQSETLLKIVLETRDLIRARVARPDDLGALAAGLPTDFLPDAEPTGVRLEP